MGAGLEPDGVVELDAVAGEQLEEDVAKSAEHGPVAVDDLELTVLGEGLGVGRQPGGIPAVVAKELAGHVARGLVGEGANVLDAVRAVLPRAAGRCHLGRGRGLVHGDTTLAKGGHLGGGDGHCRGDRHGGGRHC
jgi:hypothetical protein